MGLGRVINTVIAAQAQGLTHSEVITYSPVDCSLSLSLHVSLSVTQDGTLSCGKTDLPELKYPKITIKKLRLDIILY